jgi:hypothetical protein
LLGSVGPMLWPNAMDTEGSPWAPSHWMGKKYHCSLASAVNHWLYSLKTFLQFEQFATALPTNLSICVPELSSEVLPHADVTAWRFGSMGKKWSRICHLCVIDLIGLLVATQVSLTLDVFFLIAHVLVSVLAILRCDSVSLTHSTSENALTWIISCHMNHLSGWLDW